jgi:hypothetical protein
MDKSLSRSLEKFADSLLKAADSRDAFEKSKQRQLRLIKLHEAMTRQYKFAMNPIIKPALLSEVTNDINVLKKLEKKLTLTPSQTETLETFYHKYKV